MSNEIPTALWPEIYYTCTITALSVFSLMGVIYFAVIVETLKMGAPLQWKTVLTPFTGFLVGLILAITGVFACETAILYTLTTNGRESFQDALILSVKSIFDALSLFSYLKYSWLRAESIVDQVFPKLHIYVIVLMKVFPIFFVIEIGSISAAIPFFQNKALFKTLRLICQGTMQ
ncbi:hypothetical protein BCR33DRAFT_218703 [Rhizoclosmatium globosum]|uniref:Uncharacterized protein n=1 Tax=Rhizoclosmatium globosum TaxID=329046 RepID=A0A1Y2CB85_9FUNG|nr:hypothetical protein BCR33DRAFT_218703 [Rhizoclosmatium globosum]|eukprot:ORY44293.1 hypothetical protein BCR33DRAFT_218703 [Rhizoclosmatium globosum]